jgi:histidinol-phosphate phosphatase family protein
MHTRVRLPSNCAALPFCRSHLRFELCALSSSSSSPFIDSPPPSPNNVPTSGEVPEWLNGPVSKTGSGRKFTREFESPPLRFRRPSPAPASGLRTKDLSSAPSTQHAAVKRPVIFLDRDDTLIEANSLPPPPPPAARGDITDPAQVRLLPHAVESCRRLKRAGFLLIVVSNQGTVARGGAPISTIHAVNRRVHELLPDIDAFYFCPFHPKGAVPGFTREHPWRKPAPGMLLAAAAEFQIDLANSWLIGDADRDIHAGRAAGLPHSHCLLLDATLTLPAATDLILR